VGIANIAYGANPSIYRKMLFDSEKDFTPVGQIAIVTLVLSTHPSVPAKSVREYIALAKSRPGMLTYSSAGNGSANHLATARFSHMAGLKLEHVPYKGGGPRGHRNRRRRSDDALRHDPSAISHFKSGPAARARGLQRETQSGAAGAAYRRRSGTAPGLRCDRMAGRNAARRRSRDVVVRLNQAFSKVTSLPDVKEKVAALGADLVSGTPEEYDAFLKRELATWSKVVKAVGIKID
jgi:tripartite-type tricarboxylate transporter receptor subunit TctC